MLFVLLRVLKQKDSREFIFWAVPNVIVFAHAMVAYLHLNFEISLHIR